MADDPSLIPLYTTNGSWDLVPKNLSALSLGEDSIQLTWTELENKENFICYNVFFAHTNDLIFHKIGEVTNSLFIVTGLNTGREYHFSVSASFYDAFSPTGPVLSEFLFGYGMFGETPIGVVYSGVSSGIYYAQDPDYIPTGILVNGVSETSIQINWQLTLPTGKLPVSGFRIWRTTEYNGVLRSVGSTTGYSYLDEGLVEKQPYYYRVTSLY